MEKLDSARISVAEIDSHIFSKRLQLYLGDVCTFVSQLLLYPACVSIISILEGGVDAVMCVPCRTILDDA